MHLKELFNYKNKIMEIICSNEDIVKLITKKKTVDVPYKDIVYKQVFPYEYIPETVDNAKTFICFDVDIPYVNSKTVYDPQIYIWIFTHKSNMRLEDGGVRVDELCCEIDEILNGNKSIGLGTLELSAVGRFAPIVDYQGRVLTYSAKDFNRVYSQQTPPQKRY